MKTRPHSQGNVAWQDAINFLPNSCFYFTFKIANAWSATCTSISSFYSRFSKGRKPTTCLTSILPKSAHCFTQVHPNPEISQNAKYSVGDACYFYTFCLVITQLGFLRPCYTRGTVFSQLRSKMSTEEIKQSEWLILFFRKGRKKIIPNHS